MSCVLLDEEASQSETLALSACDSSETSQSKTETPWHFLEFFQLTFPITKSTTVNAVL